MTTMPTMPAGPGTTPATPGTAATDLISAASGAVALGNAPASEAGAGFLALVQQALHLVDGPGTTPQGAGAKAGTTGTGAAAEKDPKDTDDAAAATDPGAGVPALATVLPFLPNLAVPVATPAAAAMSATAATGSAAVGANGARSAPATVPIGRLSVVARTAKDERGAATGDAARGNDPTTTDPAASAAPATHVADAAAPAPPVTATDPSSQPVQAVQTAHPVPTTAATDPTPATPALDPVSTQVVDKITSMADRGTGTHRLTMKLNPEQLGEVRVVMTVRDGAVHVRLAASEHQAHQALLDGSSELNRLLEAAGHADARVTVRETGRSSGGDLGQGAGSSNDWASQASSGQGAGEGRASDRSPDQHAGTRAEQNATDGTHQPRRFTAGTTGTRSNESVTPSRVTGLDVTM